MRSRIITFGWSDDVQIAHHLTLQQQMAARVHVYAFQNIGHIKMLKYSVGHFGNFIQIFALFPRWICCSSSWHILRSSLANNHFSRCSKRSLNHNNLFKLSPVWKRPRQCRLSLRIVIRLHLEVATLILNTCAQYGRIIMFGSIYNSIGGVIMYQNDTASSCNQQSQRMDWTKASTANLKQKPVILDSGRRNTFSFSLQCDTIHSVARRRCHLKQRKKSHLNSQQSQRFNATWRGSE